MHVIITGATGQVGRHLVRLCRKAGVAHSIIGRGDADFSRGAELKIGPVLAAAREAAPGPGPCVLVNLAAYTDVEAAEAPENRALAAAINGAAPGALATACAAQGVALIHVSTDYVFPGTAPLGSLNAEDAVTGPLNVYGASKLAGEEAVARAGREQPEALAGAAGARAVVVRTSWVYSGPSEPGKDFVTTMVSLAERGVTPGVVADQWGRLTAASDLAAVLLALAEALVERHPLPALLHAAGGGNVATWCDVAREVFALRGKTRDAVAAVTTAEYPTRAQRPLNAALDTSLWRQSGLPELPAWQETLARVLR